MKTADYTYLTYFLIFKHLKRVGKIKSRLDLDPFLYSPDLERVSPWPQNKSAKVKMSESKWEAWPFEDESKAADI